METQIIEFKNGLKLLYLPAPYSASTHIGYTINVGSRDDGDLPGTAHCFEHMLFKGTSKRKTLQIINRLEHVGGEMNAYTTKELTVVYASVVNQYAIRALDLLTDITFFSVFPTKELEKEKRVITEEINMYLDTPEENIYDEFQEMVFKGHSLAPNILGNYDTLNKINSNHLKSFHNVYYQPENVTLSISSSLPVSTFKKWIEKAIEAFPKGKKKIPARTEFKKYKAKQLSKVTEHVQCHAILGNICYPQYHPKRYPLLLMNNILGGPSMNSRLTLSIREKHGYTYNVESGYSGFSETGLFHCYLSTDKNNLNKSVDLIYKELKKLQEIKLSSNQLQQAITQFKGQLVLAEESRINLMLLLAKNLTQGYPIETLSEVLHKIDKINSEEIIEIANELFIPEKMSYLAYVSE